MSKLIATIKSLLHGEPVATVGALVGVLAGLLVKYMHLDANTAQQVAAGAVPFLGSLIARQFVTPVRKLEAEHPLAAAQTLEVLRGILAALTIDEPAVKVIDTSPPEYTATAPDLPAPWTAPPLDIPAILPSTPPAATVASAPSPESAPVA
jgi:hypothetical protein